MLKKRALRHQMLPAAKDYKNLYVYFYTKIRLVSFHVRNMQIFREDLRIFITIILLNITIIEIDINLLYKENNVRSRESIELSSLRKVLCAEREISGNKKLRGN